VVLAEFVIEGKISKWCIVELGICSPHKVLAVEKMADQI